MEYELIGLILASTSTFLSLLMSVLKEHILLDPAKFVSHIKASSEKSAKGEVPDEPHVMKRLRQAKDAYEREKRNERFSNVANFLLVFGQYVVGVLLTSSFLSETLSLQSLGILGLVVLVSTTLHQKYRPDLSARMARAKACWLLAAIHKAEDSLVFIQQGLPDAPKEENIIKMLSRHLVKVEDEEEWMPENSEDK
jgi:hypothetical protein